MKLIKSSLLVAALALPLAGCEEGAATSGTSRPSASAGQSSSVSMNRLAEQGNLSPDAIRLQTMSSQLLSLEQEQKAAKDRTSSFRTQGAGLGAGAGLLAGLIACEIGGCSSAQRNQVMAIGAVGGGVAGYQMGDAQAERQNNAAQAENALQRQLQIAGQQLDKAREARALAQRVAVTNQNKLTQLQAEVTAGRATKAQLDLARADAAADAVQVQKAATTMENSTDTMKGQQPLANSRTALTKEEAATQKSYDALSKSIKNSAL